METRGAGSHDVDEDPVEIGLHRHPPTHQGVVADGGERVDVGPHVDVPARDLLRWHRGRGSDDETAVGELPVAVDPLGEAEVEEPHAEAPPSGQRKTFSGLMSRVNDSLPVGGPEEPPPAWPEEGGYL